MDMVKKMSLTFTAGCIGGFMNGIAVWLFGLLGITTALGVSIAPALTPSMLYHRIVWGGLWGFIFLLPFMQGQLIRKGIALSLGPTLVQLFVVFPFKANKGFLGLDLGVLTPLFVVVFNAVWGIVAAIWLRQAETAE